MANSASQANVYIHDYAVHKQTYISYRSNLLTTLGSYSNNSATGLLIRSYDGKEFWIIFVKSYTLTPTSGNIYSITLKGTGMHIVLNSPITNSNFLAYCNDNTWDGTKINETSNITGIMDSFEFFGTTGQMTLQNLIQNNTVVQSDDISDIDEISVQQFENLSTGLAINSNAMPLA